MELYTIYMRRVEENIYKENEEREREEKQRENRVYIQACTQIHV